MTTSPSDIPEAAVEAAAEAAWRSTHGLTKDWLGAGKLVHAQYLNAAMDALEAAAAHMPADPWKLDLELQRLRTTSPRRTTK